MKLLRRRPATTTAAPEPVLGGLRQGTGPVTTTADGGPGHGTAPTARIAVEDLTVTFGHGSRAHTALHGVTLCVAPGTALGVVGESGSGKSTLARTVVGLVRPRAGRVLVDGQDVVGLRGAALTRMRRRVQLVPQDPNASLNPRMTVGRAVAEAIDPVRADTRRYAADVARWLETVALDPDAADRYPHEFSGGQRQRIAVARALAAEPEVVIADEVTSSLDCSVQAEVLNLLADLRVRLSLTLLFISHDLAVVRHVCDEVAVMHRGRVVEHGPCAEVYREPEHPYTRRLFDSIPALAPLPDENGRPGTPPDHEDRNR
ncbi:ABC transporter ATP-binding protein [Streptomyces sp. NPDC006367]|uniref:ABC transporter ATP-binding protein n=1 Tax=unclassified Streptomyces TaxID=2593676 RepID=UPI0033BCF5DB